jgi:UDP-GlcNAc:undecaprenyl-phosphate/decaprenyl-phosphate GlcNAc-1-phosphate transferase
MSHPTAGAVARSVTAAAVAAATAAAVSAATRARPPGGAARWTRTNHRGEPISLLEGPAFVAGALAGVALAPGVGCRTRAAAALAVGAAGALGAYDDLAEGTARKGLAGHLGALAHGEVTTGAVKVLGLSLTGLVCAGLARPGPAGRPARPALGWVFDTLVGGAVVAGTANLLNLLDLRPGRALKVVLVLAPATLGAGPAAVPLAATLGAAAALLPDDLAERTMLGDTGANAAGALLGLVAAQALGRRGRLGLLGALVALTAASERVSFTAVIERTPVLRELDRWGRRPR